SHDPADLKAQVQENLAHLGVDTLDAVNLRLRADGTGRESVAESFGALAELTEAQAIAPVVTVQNLYNLATRRDDALVDRCAAEGIAYAAYFPLGGFTPLQSATLDRVATRLGASPHQVALAWLLQRSPTMVLIPGTSSVAHLRENIAAADLDLPSEAVA